MFCAYHDHIFLTYYNQTNSGLHTMPGVFYINTFSIRFTCASLNNSHLRVLTLNSLFSQSAFSEILTCGMPNVELAKRSLSRALYKLVWRSKSNKLRPLSPEIIYICCLHILGGLFNL